MRIFYVDDSGDEEIAVLAVLSFQAEEWHRVLTEWLGWRKWMWKEFGLPIDFELHAPEFLSGRGEIPHRGPGGEPVLPDINSLVGLRKQAYQLSLKQIERQEE